jgi:creatinine amidohydrolase
MRDTTASLLPMYTTEDVRASAAEVALLPVGSHEQHGPHLPLATDTVIACTLARALAEAHPVLELPPITVSCSHEHAAWPGTLSVSAATLQAMVGDIAESLRRSGIAGLVVVNGHGGNYVLGNVVQEATAIGRRMALFPALEDWEDARARAGLESPMVADMHAGEAETSILLHAHPQLVRPGYDTADHRADDRRHLLSRGLDAYTSSGVVGVPSAADARKGQLLLAALVDAFPAHLAAPES